MSLPDKSKLESIREAGNKDSSLGLPTSGYFWSFFGVLRLLRVLRVLQQWPHGPQLQVQEQL